MALHNAVPQGTTVPWGTAWCIINFLSFELKKEKKLLKCIENCKEKKSDSFKIYHINF